MDLWGTYVSFLVQIVHQAEKLSAPLAYLHIRTNTGPSWRAFLIMLGFNLSYVTVANGLVWLEPLAAGSGIPEIKSFLNGIDLPRVVSLSA